LLNRFYDVAMSALIPRRAIIDKMIGDEIMAFFVPAAKLPQQKTALEVAEKILEGVGFGSGSEPWLPVGIGINHGEAYVGKVGTGDVNDFTALGDTVNTASRLQNEASAGQIVVSESVYSEISDKYPDVPVQNIVVRGREEQFGVHTLKPFE
jgi:adenylate cyclase